MYAFVENRRKDAAMNKKEILLTLLTPLLAAGMTVGANAAFTDTADHWAEDAITKWSQEYSIIQGYDDGTFRPDNSITRGAFAGILDRFLQFRTISPVSTFSDIKGNYWETEILKLHASGVYLGNNGKALAGDTITRQQAVTMIARAFQVEAGETISLPYEDAGDIAWYAQGVVSEMTARGYVNDCEDGNFRPTDPITRAEIVNILNNMVEVLLQTDTPYSQNVNGNLMVSSANGAALSNMTITGDLILAPGVRNAVTLDNVTIQGSLRNFSGVEPTTVTETPQDPEEEETPAASGIQPSAVYTPGTTTGESIAYGSRQIPVYEGVERSRLYDGDFYWNEDRLEYIGGDFDTQFGIDVSAYQNRSSENQTIDWNAVKEDGVDFAMVRIGLRGTSSGVIYADQYYAENIDGAMAAGIETGVYFFAQAVTVEEAIEEADFVIDLLKDHKINGPVAYDWEMNDSSYRVYGTTPEMATACAIAFCQRIEAAGYTPMIYAGLYVSYVKYDQGAISKYLSWYPEYKSASSEKLCPTFYYQVDYWQFSSSCAIAGIGGRVDADIKFIPR
jgi:GH25 family lysozyme M1 (1,4-beta-N-acetylmuramidase)